MSAQTTFISQAQHIGISAAKADSRFSRIYRGMLASAGFAAFVLVSAPALAATLPPLGSTDTYGIVSSTTTSVTPVTVNGNVCYTTAPATPLTVNSGTKFIPCTSQIADQATALADLNGQACVSLGAVVTLDTTTPPGGGLGSYPPGCYSSTGAMNITGGATVTLNGVGVYIFRPAGALTANAGSIISLVGTTANDVFWTPTSATTLLAGTAFKGTIIDAAGITFGAGTTLTGRALAAGGTVTLDSNTITSPILPTPPPAPVPTLSEWAMITFALLIAGFGLQMMRRRRLA